MSSKQIFETLISHPAITSAAPSGDVGINFADTLPQNTMKWRKILLAVTIIGGASDCTLWLRRNLGVIGDETDDVWGLFQDMFGVIKLGKIGTALAAGVYFFIVPDVGAFAGLYVQNSANTMTVSVSPIQEGHS